MISFGEFLAFEREQDANAQLQQAATALLKSTNFVSIAVTYAPQLNDAHRVLYAHGYSQENMRYLSCEFLLRDHEYRTFASQRKIAADSWDNSSFGRSYTAKTWLQPAGYRNGISVAIHDDRYGEVGSLHVNCTETHISDSDTEAVIALAHFLSASFNRRKRQGTLRLTERECDIIRLVAKGESNPEIATALHLSRSTVATHIEHVLRKVGTSSRVGIAVEAVRLGLV